MMFGNGFGGNAGCFGFGGFGGWMYLIMIGVVLLIVAAYIWFRNQNNVSSNKQALNLLDEKFVKGEITEEEYLNKKSIMRK